MTARRWRTTAALALVGVAGLLGAQGAGARTDTSARPPRPPVTRTQLLPSAIFSRPVVSRPVAAGSAGYVSRLVEQYHSHYGSVGVNGMPLFSVGPRQARVPVGVSPACNNFESSVGSVPIPAAAYTTDPHYQADSDLIVYQPSTSTAWELWQAKRSASGQWSACWGGRLDTATSDGLFPKPFGLSATGISYLATTVTEQDVASGRIGHTIALDVAACNYYTYPAGRGDCAADPGQPPEGSWFRMPASVSMPAGLTSYGRMVFSALQTYGAVVTDQAGAVMVQGETTRDWSATGHRGIDPITASWQGRPEYATLSGVPWSKLQVISPP